MAKKDKKITTIYSYQVTMMVHVVADDPIEARKKLDEQGGIMTAREVEVLNAQPLYGEKEND